MSPYLTVHNIISQRCRKPTMLILPVTSKFSCFSSLNRIDFYPLLIWRIKLQCRVSCFTTNFKNCRAHSICQENQRFTRLNLSWKLKEINDILPDKNLIISNIQNQCRTIIVAKVAYATVPTLSRARAKRFKLSTWVGHS